MPQRTAQARRESAGADIMTPRDRLQRLLFEHRTAHDPASSEREILRMFEAMQSLTICECGDHFTEHGKGACVNCCAVMDAAQRHDLACSTAHTKEQA